MRFFLILCLITLTATAQQLPVKQPDSVIKIIYASYYAKKFEGRKTTSGERYRAKKLTAAHRTLSFGTIINVTNLHNGKQVSVRVNDRGPFSKKFSLDLSEGAAKKIGIYRLGYARVQIAYLPKN